MTKNGFLHSHSLPFPCNHSSSLLFPFQINCSYFHFHFTAAGLFPFLSFPFPHYSVHSSPKYYRNTYMCVEDPAGGDKLQRQIHKIWLQVLSLCNLFLHVVMQKCSAGFFTITLKSLLELISIGIRVIPIPIPVPSRLLPIPIKHPRFIQFLSHFMEFPCHSHLEWESYSSGHL